MPQALSFAAQTVYVSSVNNNAWPLDNLTWPTHQKPEFLELLGYQKNFKNFKGFYRKMKDFCRIFSRFSRNVVRLSLIFSTAIVIHTVEPQVGQARNMSIGEHRHSKYTDLYGKNTYRFCNLQK